MTFKRWSWVVLAASIGAAHLEWAPAIRAQQATLPYPLRMTSDQAQRIITAWNQRQSYVPGEVLVKFRSGLGVREMQSVLSMLRAAPDQRRETWIGNTLLVQSDADPESDAVAQQLSLQPEVEWVQPNYVRRFQSTPNDPGYSRQWNFDAIKMPQAWDINPGASSAITVAVVDSGTTTTTTTLALPLWTGSRIETVPVPVAMDPDIPPARVAAGYDFIFWNGPVVDFVGHGTYVAGTVLQETNNNFALAGIAYKARLMPLKACLGYWELQIIQSVMGTPGKLDPSIDGFCTDVAIAQAIRYAADNGAQVVNVSLGAPQPAFLLDDAIRYATGRGTFVALAGGNSYEEGNPVEYPAAYALSIDGAMAVGAVGRSNRRAPYSSTGAHIEIVAPGGDFFDGGLAGLVYQTSLFPLDFDPFTTLVPRFDRYFDFPAAGTSISAPHVAGVAALLYSQGITKPSAIEAAMKRFAVDLGPAGRDDDFGAGLLDARASLRGLGVAR